MLRQKLDATRTDGDHDAPLTVIEGRGFSDSGKQVSKTLGKVPLCRLEYRVSQACPVGLVCSGCCGPVWELAPSGHAARRIIGPLPLPGLVPSGPSSPLDTTNMLKLTEHSKATAVDTQGGPQPFWLKASTMLEQFRRRGWCNVMMRGIMTGKEIR